MPVKRQIRAKDVVSDIRSGLTDEELMNKHQLSQKSLAEVLRKLLAAGALNELEMEGRAPLESDDSPTERDAARGDLRGYVVVRLPVYDLNNLTVEGHVHDISETDLKVAGLRGDEGDSHSLLIQSDELADVYPFTFDAQCVSAENKEADEECIAGFEITNISDMGRQELRKLCKLLAFS